MDHIGRVFRQTPESPRKQQQDDNCRDNQFRDEIQGVVVHLSRGLQKADDQSNCQRGDKDWSGNCDGQINRGSTTFGSNIRSHSQIHRFKAFKVLCKSHAFQQHAYGQKPTVDQDKQQQLHRQRNH